MTTKVGDRLGPVGVWVSLGALSTDEVLSFARTAEDLGFGAFWVNETIGREPFATLGALAVATERIGLGVGIASVYARDAVAAHAGARTIAELSRGRFVMGLGVSHRSSAATRGHDYGPPLTTMRAYLDAYDAAPWAGPPVEEPPLVIAALGPRMLSLAATRTAGAFPFLVTTEQIRAARRTLDETADPAGGGDRPVLVVSHLTILGDGPKVRETARASVARYVGQPAYRNNLVRAGFATADVEAVADVLVGALVATGDAAALQARVAAMHDAGADHVAVIPLSPDGLPADLATARAVAPR